MAFRIPAATSVIALLAILSGCSGNPQPRVLLPQTMAPVPPETLEPVSNLLKTTLESLPVVEPVGDAPLNNAPAATAREIVPVQLKNDHLTVILETGEEDDSDKPPSLFEASQAEKSRRLEVGKSTIILTNKTLKDYSKGRLTYLEEDSEAVHVAEDQIARESALQAQDEAYWRDLVLDLRLSWREALDDIEEYESEIARLRRDFYAEDDPFYRDAQIKPAWDQALQDLKDAQRSAQRSQQDLERTLEDGRREGALPGWLREGLELEPPPAEIERVVRRDDRVHEPSEPVIVDDGGGGGGV